ncbi:MAG: hypothetical protein ACJ74Z_22960 [Bryobacteraceae bacterium]
MSRSRWIFEVQGQPDYICGQPSCARSGEYLIQQPGLICPAEFSLAFAVTPKNARNARHGTWEFNVASMRRHAMH